MPDHDEAADRRSPGLELLTYERVSPWRDEPEMLTVSAGGAVQLLGRRGRSLGSWELAGDLRADVLERLTLALDDADFPNPPAAGQLPDSTSLLVRLEAGGRVGEVAVPSTARDDAGGWSELIRLLDSLVEQAERRLAVGAGQAEIPDEGILPDCLA